jgi:hypothetical protein
LEAGFDSNSNSLWRIRISVSEFEFGEFSSHFQNSNTPNIREFEYKFELGEIFPAPSPMYNKSKCFISLGKDTPKSGPSISAIERAKTPDPEGTKLEFFEMGSCVPFASTIKSHLDIGGIFIWCIDEKIVTNIIGELLFDPATTDERHDAAMSIFKQNEGDDEDNQAGAFQVTIRKTMALNLSHLTLRLDCASDKLAKCYKKLIKELVFLSFLGCERAMWQSTSVP